MTYLRNQDPRIIATHLTYELSDLRMICGKLKTALTRREQYITARSLSDDLIDDRLCDRCSDDPIVQLRILAAVDL